MTHSLTLTSFYNIVDFKQYNECYWSLCLWPVCIIFLYSNSKVILSVNLIKGFFRVQLFCFWITTVLKNSLSKCKPVNYLISLLRQAILLFSITPLKPLWKLGKLIYCPNSVKWVSLSLHAIIKSLYIYFPRIISLVLNILMSADYFNFDCNLTCIWVDIIC